MPSLPSFIWMTLKGYGVEGGFDSHHSQSGRSTTRTRSDPPSGRPARRAKRRVYSVPPGQDNVPSLGTSRNASSSFSLPFVLMEATS